VEDPNLEHARQPTEFLISTIPKLNTYLNICRFGNSKHSVYIFNKINC